MIEIIFFPKQETFPFPQISGTTKRVSLFIIVYSIHDVHLICKVHSESEGHRPIYLNPIFLEQTSEQANLYF